jgi:hypothetical protein
VPRRPAVRRGTGAVAAVPGAPYAVVRSGE